MSSGTFMAHEEWSAEEAWWAIDEWMAQENFREHEGAREWWSFAQGGSGCVSDPSNQKPVGWDLSDSNMSSESQGGVDASADRCFSGQDNFSWPNNSQPEHSTSLWMEPGSFASENTENYPAASLAYAEATSNEPLFTKPQTQFQRPYNKIVVQVPMNATCTINRKIKRSRYTRDTIECLKKWYATKPSPTPADRALIAKECGLDDQRINVWFRNQRHLRKKK